MLVLPSVPRADVGDESPRSREVRVGGLRIRVLEAGPAATRDDPVLLVHGLAGWAENWWPVIPAIAESGRDAIAFDLPGFGESERPRGAKYFDPAEPFYARFVHELLDTLGIERVHLAGHSLGGAIAYTAAAWEPSRFRSLTLVAPGGLGVDLPRELRLMTLPGMELLARWRSSPSIARAVLYSCFHDPSRCPPELLEEAVRYAGVSAGEMIRVLRSCVGLGGIREKVRRSWLSRVHRYRGPALVVWGREDRILPVRHAEAARDLAPQADIRVVDRCGHLVMVERPAEFLGAFLPFLDRAL